ncbi:hypothetical protein, partial [uncultured Algoriphagus sp.]|uniref:hypothetical protein n=1 Tax=uncultured Algoriphagus sp. TaxID=417365 RepID=UPI0032B1ACCF
VLRLFHSLQEKISRQEANAQRFISSSNFDETASFLAETPLFMTHESSKLPTANCLLHLPTVLRLF